jgi:hypothetical protein
MFWSYFAGIDLIAAGVGTILRIQACLTALVLGLMIFFGFWFFASPEPSSA